MCPQLLYAAAAQRKTQVWTSAGHCCTDALSGHVLPQKVVAQRHAPQAACQGVGCRTVMRRRASVTWSSWTVGDRRMRASASDRRTKLSSWRGVAVITCHPPPPQAAAWAADHSVDAWGPLPLKLRPQSVLQLLQCITLAGQGAVHAPVLVKLEQRSSRHGLPAWPQQKRSTISSARAQGLADVRICSLSQTLHNALVDLQRPQKWLPGTTARLALRDVPAARMSL